MILSSVNNIFHIHALRINLICACGDAKTIFAQNPQCTPPYVWRARMCMQMHCMQLHTCQTHLKTIRARLYLTHINLLFIFILITRFHLANVWKWDHETVSIALLRCNHHLSSNKLCLIRKRFFPHFFFHFAENPRLLAFHWSIELAESHHDQIDCEFGIFLWSIDVRAVAENLPHPKR